jgi:hypothetical protein
MQKVVYKTKLQSLMMEALQLVRSVAFLLGYLAITMAVLLVGSLVLLVSLLLGYQPLQED